MERRAFSKALQYRIKQKAVFFKFPHRPLVEWLTSAFLDKGGCVWSHSLASFGVCETEEGAKRLLNKLEDLGFIAYVDRQTGEKGRYFIEPGPMLRRLDSRYELHGLGAPRSNQPKVSRTSLSQAVTHIRLCTERVN